MNVITKIRNAVREYVAALDESMPQLAGPVEQVPVFVGDLFNNVGRYGQLRGDTTRQNWRVEGAVGGRRYFVRNTATDETRTVGLDDLTSLY
jgi:hypothetical protein